VVPEVGFAHVAYQECPTNSARSLGLCLLVKWHSMAWKIPPHFMFVFICCRTVLREGGGQEPLAESWGASAPPGKQRFKGGGSPRTRPNGALDYVGAVNLTAFVFHSSIQTMHQEPMAYVWQSLTGHVPNGTSISDGCTHLPKDTSWRDGCTH
jgi:hypothetical protein